MAEDVTRLAPSPTGALHLGNARTFLINWALARQQGWRIVLRIEDLDTPRTKRGADVDAIKTLHWLGMSWDQGPYYQVADLSRYQAALERLAARGAIYPCGCTRSQIVSAQSAPHGDEHELRYPGTCRPPEPAPVRYVREADVCWRLRVPDETVEFTDVFAGPQVVNVQRLVGDFVVATRAGLPAYQLAVVVDDHDQGVTQVVRGDDLISSTPRQMLLYRELDLGEPPRYLHVPLVLGEDGRRLAKRHGDTRLSTFREGQIEAERIIGLIAGWCGMAREPMTAAAFAGRFDLQRLSHGPVTYTDADRRWLMQEEP